MLLLPNWRMFKKVFTWSFTLWGLIVITTWGKIPPSKRQYLGPTKSWAFSLKYILLLGIFNDLWPINQENEVLKPQETTRNQTGQLVYFTVIISTPFQNERFVSPNLFAFFIYWHFGNFQIKLPIQWRVRWLKLEFGKYCLVQSISLFLRERERW